LGSSETQADKMTLSSGTTNATEVVFFQEQRTTTPSAACRLRPAAHPGAVALGVISPGCRASARRPVTQTAEVHRANPPAPMSAGTGCIIRPIRISHVPVRNPEPSGPSDHSPPRLPPRPMRILRLLWPFWFGCGQRPRWGIGAIRGSILLPAN
jgi:hypothetical protein